MHPLETSVSGKLFVHCGCGRIDLPGYVNVDLTPMPHVHYVVPITDLFMFSNGTVDLLYASHVLEHLSVAEAKAALHEWVRVLKSKGTLRLAVPDFSILSEIYREKGDLEAMFGPLLGGQTDSKNFHKSAYDELYLSRLLLAAGLVRVRRWDPVMVMPQGIRDSSSTEWEVGGRKWKISLNLEADRP
jgi:SAM-dependent methyltransferase